MLHHLSDNSPLVAIADGLSSNHVREHIPDGDAGTAETIKRMQKLVSRSKRDFNYRILIGKILDGKFPCAPKVGNKDHYAYCRNFYLFCRDCIRYVFDPSNVEYIEKPDLILKSGVADCDSVVMLFAALCESAGYPCEFVTIKADAERQNEYSHVFARVQIPNVGWVSADPTMPTKYFGWQAPQFYAIKYWNSSLDDIGPVDDSPSVSPENLPANTAGAASMLSGLADTGWCGGPFMSGLSCAGKKDCNCGCGPKTMSGMRGLGDTNTSILDILNGNALQQIKQLYSDYQNNAAALDRAKAALDATPMSQKKLQAIVALGKGEESLRQQFVIYRTARDQYNDFVTQAKPYFFGVWNPGLAGLQEVGALGVIPQAVIVIAGIAALALLADKIAGAIAAGQGKSIETKGYIGQAADLVDAGSNLIGSVTKAAIVGGLGFLAFTLMKRKGWVGSK